MQKSFDLVDPATTGSACKAVHVIEYSREFEGSLLPAYFTDASTDARDGSRA